MCSTVVLTFLPRQLAATFLELGPSSIMISLARFLVSNEHSVLVMRKTVRKTVLCDLSRIWNLTARSRDMACDDLRETTGTRCNVCLLGETLSNHDKVSISLSESVPKS
jgi:hypothetical protein